MFLFRLNEEWMIPYNMQVACGDKRYILYFLLILLLVNRNRITDILPPPHPYLPPSHTAYRSNSKTFGVYTKKLLQILYECNRACSYISIPYHVSHHYFQFMHQFHLTSQRYMVNSDEIVMYNSLRTL